jgi:hypothetical protein
MRRFKLWIVVSALLLAHLVYGFFLPAVFDHVVYRVFIFGLLGICFGQINLIASWATLAPGSVIVRVPWTGFLAVLMWYAILLGNRAHARELDREEAILLGWVLIAGVIVAQIPLWIASRFFSWRLVAPTRLSAENGRDEKQFNIQHLLGGTFLVSLALALSRVILPPGDDWIPTGLDDELRVLLPVAAIWNVLTTVPCFWAAFAKKEGMVVWFFSWFVYCAVLTGAEFAVLSVILGAPFNDEVFLMIYVFNLTQCWCVFTSLLAIRAVGFRFMRIA